eukprot:449384-Amphidinium_carterae.2
MASHRGIEIEASQQCHRTAKKKPSKGNIKTITSKPEVPRPVPGTRVAPHPEGLVFGCSKCRKKTVWLRRVPKETWLAVERRCWVKL